MELLINWIYLAIILGGVCLIVVCVVLLCFLVYHRCGKTKGNSLYPTEFDEHVLVQSGKPQETNMVSRKQAPQTSFHSENPQVEDLKCERCNEEDSAAWMPVLMETGQSALQSQQLVLDSSLRQEEHVKQITSVSQHTCAARFG